MVFGEIGGTAPAGHKKSPGFPHLCIHPFPARGDFFFSPIATFATLRHFNNCNDLPKNAFATFATFPKPHHIQFPKSGIQTSPETFSTRKNVSYVSDVSNPFVSAVLQRRHDVSQCLPYPFLWPSLIHPGKGSPQVAKGFLSNASSRTSPHNDNRKLPRLDS